jgi:diacylglycerol kinase (ATP)
MFIIPYYVMAAAVFFSLSALSDNLFLIIVLVWIGASLSVVSIAYLFKRPQVFRKSQNGAIPFYIRWLFVPFLVGVQCYNLWERKNDKVPPIQKIDDKLFLACRLFPSDIAQLQSLGVQAILDVTAEFDGLDWSATDEDLHYLNIPVLDHQAPRHSDLHHAVNWINHHIQNERGVVIHCALGRGRSVLVMAAYLLSQKDNVEVRDVLERIQGVRSTADLNKTQLKALVKARKSEILRFVQPLCIIANPVAGGGKWGKNKALVLQMLSPHYKVEVLETSESTSAAELTRQAKAAGHGFIVACGGDGTISEVANELVGSDICLGLLPMGTANSLCHVFLGVTTKILPVETACEALIANYVQRIDTAECNDELVLLVAGIGLSQKMIEQADREHKNADGQFAYLQALYEAVMQNETTTFKVSTDNQDLQDITTPSLVVANAAPFTSVLAQGGGEPDFSDGLLDITWLPGEEDVSDQFINLSTLAMKALGVDIAENRLGFIQAKHVTISSDKKIKYIIDGENREADKIEIKVNPKSLNVCCTERDNETAKAG